MTRLPDIDPARYLADAAATLVYARTGEGSASGAEALRLVATAAEARAALERGEAVSTGQLSALAGLSEAAGYVRQLVRAGELLSEHAGTHARIPAEAARAWLASRGVVGFAGAGERK